MTSSRISRARLLGEKMLRSAPEIILHPTHISPILRGAHWATLHMLDSPWIRGLGVDTILDVGANTGQFASASRVVFPQSRIYSFEPLRDCFERLEHRMQRDTLFRAINVAIGSFNGEATMHRSSFAESSSLLRMSQIHREAFPWTAGESDTMVSVRRLDSLLPEMNIGACGFLKIDVQGFENSVLEGASETLSRMSIVMVEVSFEKLYTGEAGFQDIHDIMISHGFQFSGLMDQLTHPTTRRILQGDALYLRQDNTS